MSRTYLTSVPSGCRALMWRVKSAMRDNVTPQTGHRASVVEENFWVDCFGMGYGGFLLENL